MIELTLHCDKHRELARDRFKDPNTIKNYEIGRLPRIQVLMRLGCALEVTIDWILLGSEE